MSALGIDPGAKGALGLISHDGATVLGVWDMPSVEAGVVSEVLLYGSVLPEILEAAAFDPITLAAVERVGAMPGNGGTSMFKFGTSYGLALGAGYLALGGGVGRLVNPTPSTWKRTHRLLQTDKGASLTCAIKRWPHAAAWFRRKMDADRAEACLIAEHARLTV
jgi:hypothetical protein